MTKRLQEIEESVGTKRFRKVLASRYPTLPSLSIEEAIVRHLDHVIVAPGDFGWSDTGKWHLVYQLGKKDRAENVIRGLTVTQDTKRTLIWGSKKRIIATLGLRDMVVVDTGDALLVCPTARSAEVKEIVAKLKEQQLTKYI